MSEINPACCGEKGCGMAEKCGSETPLTMSMFATQADYWKAEADKQKHMVAHWEDLAAKYKTERDEARAECERLRSRMLGYEQEADRLTRAMLAAESREREAFKRAAKALRDQVMRVAEHIKQNADALKKYEWEGNEARCRELCASYLVDIVETQVMTDKLNALADERRNDG